MIVMGASLASDPRPALLVEEATIPTNAVRPCPLGLNADHSDGARRRRRRIAAFRVKVSGGLDLAAALGAACFFLSLTVQYDPSQPQSEQAYSLPQLRLYFEAFIRKLRRLGFELEYTRVAEATDAGIVNHFHSLFRCVRVPAEWLVRTRYGPGLDFYKLRAVWVDASEGSRGVYVKPINVDDASARASAVAYLSKYLTKQTEGGKMYWSTSRYWLPAGAREEYDSLFDCLAVRYVAACGFWHTDASKVYAPWIRWLIENWDRKFVRRPRVPVEHVPPSAAALHARNYSYERYLRDREDLFQLYSRDVEFSL